MASSIFFTSTGIFSTAQIQWQPTLDSHEIASPPSHPIPIRAAEFLMEQSSYIAASDEATTSQVSPPTGFGTNDFVVGKIGVWNPAPTINLATHTFTEVEHSFKATSLAKTGIGYQFR